MPFRHLHRHCHWNPRKKFCGVSEKIINNNVVENKNVNRKKVTNLKIEIRANLKSTPIGNFSRNSFRCCKKIGEGRCSHRLAQQGVVEVHGEVRERAEDVAARDELLAEVPQVDHVHAGAARR